MKSLKKANYLNLMKHDFSLEILVHSNNVANISLKIANEIGLYDEEKQQIYEAALYHDIGKSKIPQSVLYKSGKLSNREWDVMKKHAVYSQELYLSISGTDEETLKVATAIKHHHENWDGTGYPDRICGESIPLHSRVIKIADIFEAMIQPRVYRPYKVENVLDIMKTLKAKEIDPYIFEKSQDKLYEILTISYRENDDNWKREAL